MISAKTKLLAIIIIAFSIFPFSKLFAQADTNATFYNRMSYIFQLLEKNRVANGMLLDYAMEFTN